MASPRQPTHDTEPTPADGHPPQEGPAPLGLTAEEAGRLPSALRRRVIAFLLRWEAYDAALACLDVALADSPDLVSLYDDKARALLASGRPDEALQVLRARSVRRASLTSWQLLIHAHLARGDTETALAIARRLCDDEPDSVTARACLAEVHIARGDTVEALAACNRLAQLGPNRRRLLLAMLELYRCRGDLVSASAYAVRVEQSAAEDRPLSAATLRRLRDYYRSSGETHRAQALTAALEDLQVNELEALREALADHTGRARPAPPPADEAAPAAAAPAGAASADESPEPPTQPPVAVSAADERALREAARGLFGFEDLRSGQLETMGAVLQGMDVLSVMPTGAGKSLCYQLPAFLDRGGATLVISPLIALMKDQVESLPPPLRAVATTVNSSLDGDSLRQCIADVGAGRYRLVYAAPERLRQPPFLHALRRAGVNRLVVDEAHCVSMWGHDFRPDYLFIGRARRDLGDPPLLAMTATAPARVRRDIVRRMSRDDGDDERGMVVVAIEPCRPNLTFEAIAVANNDERLRHLIAICRSTPGSGIVYADTRRRCEELAAALRDRGLDATHYHAGIEDPAERSAVQEAFMAGQVRIMVATIAFGMGIDKADIRFIIHYRLPNSVESYYQEAGRAGRDGRPARCVLLHAPSDRATLTRRFRRDAVTIDLLRAVYAAVRRQLRGDMLGRLSLDEVAREARAEPTPVRVAVSMLEEAGLLKRHYDLPRMAMVRLRDRAGIAAPPGEGERLAELLAASAGRRSRTLALDPLELARDCGLDPRVWERHTLDWAEEGWLSYRSSGRDPLIELLPADRDRAGASVETVLDRYATIQMQRIDEIVAYAQTRRCRHDYLTRYLGGSPAARGASCGACDNCDPSRRAAGTRDAPRPRRRPPEVQEPDLSADDQALFERLRKWRYATAREAEVPPYVIAHNSVLRRIAAKRPATSGELLAIRGIGPRTLQRYGRAILEIVRDA